MLTTKFGSFTKMEKGIPLTNELLYRAAPSIFAGKKHDSRPEKYTYIPTIQVVDGLRSEGFFPSQSVSPKLVLRENQNLPST